MQASDLSEQSGWVARLFSTKRELIWNRTTSMIDKAPKANPESAERFHGP
jgi:hypothetical protein